MSKKTKNTPATTIAPRAKLQAHKETNEKAAAARLARLQTEQRAMNDLRKQGVVGDDAKLRSVLFEQEEAKKQAKETATAVSFVLSVLDGPHGERVKAFIGTEGLKGNPHRVGMILRNWLKTQGFSE